MSRKSRNAAPAAPEPAIEGVTLEQRLEDLRTTLRADAGYRVKVWRRNEATKVDELLGDMAFLEFSDMKLLETYGGGRFFCRVLDDAGKWVKGGTFTIPIAGPPKSSTPAAAAGGPSFPGGLSFADLKAIMEIGKGGGGGDPAQVAASMAAALGAVMSTTMTAMMTLMQQQKPASAPLDSLEGVLELADRLADRGSREDRPDPVMLGAFQMLGEGLKRAADAQAATAAAQQQRQPDLRLVPASTAAPPAPPAPPATTEDGVFNPAVLKPQIAILCNLAAKERDPVTYAGVLLDTLEEHQSAAYSFLEQATPEQRAQLQGQLEAFFPEIKPHQAWFGQLLAAVWESFDDTGEEPAA